MKRAKKLMGMALLVIMLMMLAAGCKSAADKTDDSKTGKTGKTESGTGDETDQTQGDTGKNTDGKSTETVTINYYGRPDENNVESTIVKNFEDQNPDVKVNYVELPDTSAERLQTINTVLQAGDSSIDVFAGDVIWPPIFVSAGYVIPLDEYLTAEELASYLSGPLSAFQIMGKTYGLPFMTDSGALYYRKDLLDKYSLKVPTTWEEVIATAEDIVEKEQNPELRGFVSYWKQAESLTSSMLEIYWAKGGTVIDENGNNVIDEGILTETLRQMKDMMDSGLTAEGIETFGTDEARKVVMAGNAVFSRDWLSGYAPYNNPETSKVAGNMEIAPLPGNGSLGGWGIMVSAFSKNKEAAVRFAKFRANYESQIIASELANITPTIKAVFEDADRVAEKPQLPKFLQVLEYSRPRPKSPYYAEISGTMMLETHSVISGITSAEESAGNIVSQVAQILN